MDATRAIQIAVANADLMICRAAGADFPRASPWWIFAAGAVIAGLLWGTMKFNRGK